MTGPAKDFNDYLAAVPEPARTTLEKLRRTIRAAVPEVTETISYRMPTFKYRGKPLVALAALRDHCSLHLMGYIPAELEADLESTTRGRAPSVSPWPSRCRRRWCGRWSSCGSVRSRAARGTELAHDGSAEPPTSAAL